jgi:hypothetical protein
LVHVTLSTQEPLKINSANSIPIGAVEKVLFNHKVHKEGAKYTKVKFYNSFL